MYTVMRCLLLQPVAGRTSTYTRIGLIRWTVEASDVDELLSAWETKILELA